MKLIKLGNECHIKYSPMTLIQAGRDRGNVAILYNEKNKKYYFGYLLHMQFEMGMDYRKFALECKRIGIDENFVAFFILFDANKLHAKSKTNYVFLEKRKVYYHIIHAETTPVYMEAYIFQCTLKEAKRLYVKLQLLESLQNESV